MTAAAGSVSSPDGRMLNRIRLGYFLYFLSLGVFLPYFSPYLVAHGFSPEQVGLSLAVVMGAKIIGPPMLGWLVDHSDRSMHWLRLAALLAVVAFGLVMFWSESGLSRSQPLWLWIAVLVLFGLAWHALLPQFDVLALRSLGAQRHRYTALRAWGSIGFIVAAVLLGSLVGTGAAGTGGRVDFVPWLLLLALILLASLLFYLPEPAHSVTAVADGSFRRRLLSMPVWGFLLAHFLINVAHGVYYAFFSIYLAEHGYHGVVIGLLWALGVVAEIVLFLLLPRLMHILPAAPLLFAAIGLMLLRWLMIGWLIDDLVWLLLAQLLHAASFGLTHAIGIHVINHQFPGKLQARGQAILSGFSYGGGAALGLYAAGWLWQHGSPHIAFGSMALVSLLAALVLLPFVHMVSWSGSQTVPAGPREMD